MSYLKSLISCGIYLIHSHVKTECITCLLGLNSVLGPAGIKMHMQLIKGQKLMAFGLDYTSLVCKQMRRLVIST